MATWGSSAQQGLHTEYIIDFDGVYRRWGGSEIIDVSNLTNAGDTVSGKRKVSDLSFSLYDGSGTIWSELGYGTEAFDKDITLRVSIGGQYDYVNDYLGTHFKWTGTSGASEYTQHQGKIVSVRKSGKRIYMRSENKLNQIKKLEWQMPVRTGGGAGQELVNFYGSYCFYNLDKSESETHWTGTLKPNCLFNISEDGMSGDMYGHNHPGVVESNYQGTGIYDTTGTGISDFLSNGFEFLDTNFHKEFPVKSFKGTFLGTYVGTVDTEELARTLGYESKSAADTDQTNGSEYELDKIRLEFSSDLSSVNDEIYESQLIRMTGDPTGVVRHCLFGKMVSDFLTESTDMGTTFANSQKTVAYQTYDQVINPKNRKVESFINDALDMTSSIFYINSNNQFEMSVYGPLDLTESIDTIGTNQIFSSSYENDINDFYNRVTLKYDWNFEKNEYAKEVTGTTNGWTLLSDRVFDSESKWIRNDNQANDFVKKLLNRYERTSPEIRFKTTMESSGRELSELVSLEDPDLFQGTKILQLVEYSKSFGKEISFRALDGENLFRRRGFGRWTSGTIGSVATVTATSIGGWGNGALGGGNGTVNNIDEDLYGTHFIWW